VRIASFYREKSWDEVRYLQYAEKHYFANFIEKAPTDEYPFFSEIKIFSNILPKDITF